MPLYDPSLFFFIPNEIIWLVMLLVNFLSIILLYRFLGKLGLYAWVPISVILANIQVVKFVQLFGLTTTLGNIVYATSFLVTDILSENHGKKDAKQAVIIGFFTIFAMTIIMNLALLFTPSEADNAHSALTAIFSLMPRIALGSVIAYIISQRHDVWAYHFWKKRWPADKFIWVRNNLSTMVSQLIDTVIFCVIAFAGEPNVPTPILLEIILTTYLMKWIVAALDTPFIYLAKYMKRGNRRIAEAVEERAKV